MIPRSSATTPDVADRQMVRVHRQTLPAEFLSKWELHKKKI